MKTKLLCLFFCFVSAFGFSQVPQGFNYQAIARDGSGNPIVNTTINVRLSILSDSSGFYTGGGTYIWEETHSNVKTNAFGMFTMVLGDPTAPKFQGTAATFSAINWSVSPLFIGAKVANPTSYKNLGTARLWSVPYSLVSDSTKALLKGSKLAVVSSNDAATAALFEVKRKDGQTVFAVYPNGVNIFVPNNVKGTKGGFAIGGFDEGKGYSQDFFKVSHDSIRAYIDNTPAKGSKGGFAIGGFDGAKGTLLPDYFMNVTGSNSVNTVDSAAQILWYPNKQAFLAGKVSILSADSVGTNSTSLGFKSRAIGNYSQAFGYKTTARGDYSTAIGKYAVAGARAGIVSTASNAFAFGNGAIARGSESYAFGSGAEASGQNSFAFGSSGIDTTGALTSAPTRASAPYSTAIGMSAQATSQGAMAFGLGSTASGTYSSVIGTNAKAQAYASTAIGVGSIASGSASSTYGYYSNAAGNYSLAMGYRASTSSGGYYGTAIGFYSSASNYYANAFGFFAAAKGNGSLSLGYSSTANASYSVAIGAFAQTGASASYAGAFGRSASANGPSSVAIGYNATTGASATDASSFGKGATSNGSTSMALGASATSTGSTSVAIGYNAQSLGDYSFAIGTYGLDGSGNANTSRPTKTTLSYSIALGMGAQSSLKGDMAFGVNTTASGGYSTAIGYAATSSGMYSSVLGYGSTASGQYSTSIGYNSTASGDKSLAIGSQYTYSVRYPVINRLTGLITWHTTDVSTYNSATRSYAIAIGNGNTAQDGGMAIGSNNNAMALGSVALGHSNWADTSYSFAAGYNNRSNGFNAFAMGESLTAQSANSFVVGTYNTISGDKYNWVDSDPLFVVGNGESGANHDAFYVNKNGYTRVNATDATYGLYAYNNCTNKSNNNVYGFYGYGYNSTAGNVYNVYGGYLKGSNISGSGDTYGSYNYAYNSSSNSGDIYSGYFYSYDQASGINYGVRSNSYTAGGSGDTYSGYFTGVDYGTGQYKGLYADVRSGASIDLAEYIYDSKGNTQPADVVIADPEKKESVLKSSAPYQSSVVGVISTKPHMTMGMDLITDTKTGEPLSGVSAARLALSGRVPVNVCGENGAIVPGDYLTTSSTPGVAMKWSLLDVNAASDFSDLKRILAENEKRRNAIIGKAVESFNGTGTGKIMVLISLQ